MPIKCCKDCVFPIRKIGCHETCEFYKKEKILLDKENKKIKELKMLDYDQYNKKGKKHKKN